MGYTPTSVGQDRATISLTTASLASGASTTGTINLGKAYRLYSITTNVACRIRLYTTAAKRDSDLSRPIGTDPTGDHGQMLEFVSAAGALSADLSPLVDGFDGESTPDGLVPYSITNQSASSAVITVTFLYVKSEI